jgi:hypothetical protein
VGDEIKRRIGRALLDMKNNIKRKRKGRKSGGFGFVCCYCWLGRRRLGRYRKGGEERGRGCWLVVGCS